MIPAIKNAGTGASRNPSFLEHTTVFEHIKVAAKTAEDLLSKHSEQPAKKQPRTFTSNKTDQLFVEDGKSQTYSFNFIFFSSVINVKKNPELEAVKSSGAHWFTINHDLKFL